MPIYEYQCQDCGDKIEIIHKVGDPLKKKCPKCGGRLKKKISAPAIRFKGKGWYVNDYPRKGTSKTEGVKDKPKSAAPPAAKNDGTPPSSGKD
jgi:putative FmdB family regulatory protein